MIISISDGLRLVGCPNDWQLQRHRIVKGTERWESFKYFSTLGQAVVQAGEQELRLSEGESLTDAIEAFSRLSHRYASLLEDVVRAEARQSDSLNGGEA